MCEVWSSSHEFKATCEIHNPKTGNTFKLPFFPLWYYDSIGTRKPLGIPLDHSLQIEGPLVFAGFGITRADNKWDDYVGERVDGKVAVVLGEVPRKDYERFPKEPYCSSDYKVSNAAKHGAKAIVWVSDPFREPNSAPAPVTCGEEIPGIFIPAFFFNQILGELQRGFDLSTLQSRIERGHKPTGPVSLDLGMKISFKGNEFETEESEHFTYFFHSGTTAEKELPMIAEKREEAYWKISGKLSIDYKEKVRFFLFPSSREKTFYTGHTGGGGARGQTIIEVYNNEIKLDPWHELTHIISRCINADAPSLTSEGLAVYMVAYMTGEGRQIDKKTIQFNDDGELIPLRKLISLEIGTRESKPHISYPESGSFVKYLIETYGMERFQRLYAEVDKAQSTDEKNRTINKVYGKSLDLLEKEWLSNLANDNT